MAKILLVDDDQNLVASLLDFLAADNHTLEAAYNGADSLQLRKPSHHNLPSQRRFCLRTIVILN